MTVLNKKTSAELYQLMLTIRRVEEKIIQIYPSDKIQSPVHLSIGQEAVSAGVCHALSKQDRIYGTYRSHGLFVSRSGDLKKMFAELYAKDAGCARGKGGSMHLAAPEAGLMACSAVVASTIPVATGDAMACKLLKNKKVIVSFFGDGAIDEGVFFESVNFAILKGLPIIYVIENNGYGIHSKLSDRRRQVKLFRVASGLGLMGKRYDGDDVFTVYSTMKAAVDQVRKKGGPVLLEYMTHRWKEHVGINDDFAAPYRSKDEYVRIKKADPLPRAEAVLLKKYKVRPTELDAWKKQIDLKIEEAVNFAESAPFPRAERLFEDVFA